ncbi:uncharacterized protein LOC114354542 [Ostrinia furnacalis]|uniref:uncharacterized protein LOC114354542 n=1 Tax=Ostrinia furnacalis TaxID=93504 RepID=UPI00103BA19E|nr:uncharacterized protein LOC114354542 [Ostrinia furnacalis]
MTSYYEFVLSDFQSGGAADGFKNDLISTREVEFVKFSKRRRGGRVQKRFDFDEGGGVCKVSNILTIYGWSILKPNYLIQSAPHTGSSHASAALARHATKSLGRDPAASVHSALFDLRKSFNVRGFAVTRENKTRVITLDCKKKTNSFVKIGMNLLLARSQYAQPRERFSSTVS